MKIIDIIIKNTPSIISLVGVVFSNKNEIEKKKLELENEKITKDYNIKLFGIVAVVFIAVLYIFMK